MYLSYMFLPVYTLGGMCGCDFKTVMSFCSSQIGQVGQLESRGLLPRPRRVLILPKVTNILVTSISQRKKNDAPKSQ